ncbi:1,4-alpha-glucan branching protein GlgB [Hirschia baltica]|uniref:1,4-alpha-glucan branching enzyme GlgB n=1 Tax=Hirschia baltica (strain ATCC 49814 / DSM 5838 / IFAM 1418) TaxID=582402 RepID=C6XKJ5_HIRBI|nr:1,4-alpha-glucan branching protein GlgB [Hirschia baltica]ACT59562.1 1,4-alpha-glucan branching enzyme [Hirschia baltica ATCC 49814]
MTLGSDRIHALISAQENDPFSVLGVHPENNGNKTKRFIARALFPDAIHVEAYTLAGKSVGELTRIDDAGLFEGSVALKKRQPIRYVAKYENGGTYEIADAYSFGPVLGPMDDYYLSEGSHLRLFDKLGAHVIEHEGAKGVHFAVWAPNAQRVSVVGDFNKWDNRRNQMRKRVDTGIWEIFLPDIGDGAAYKYEIVGPDGNTLPLKADPFAYKSELRPNTASIVKGPSERTWNDDEHRKYWADADARRLPISIYEVHPGSWRKNGYGGFLSWDEMAEQLIPYVLDMGFTHIEFLPISEFPYDPSWGYQTTGLYAPTARFGDPDGFARFVEGAHKAGLSVLIDWVPAHFPTDAHGLSRFDGTALYEHEDPRKGFHPDWNTAIFNFGRKEVVSYLVNNALFWAEHFHVDGLRVDAVASMLYLDYSREQGEWIPNEFGGRENLEAVDFLKLMNKEVYGRHPGILTMAEESTSWPKVSHPVHEGGLGFGFKWNMGFMNDTLRYLARDPVHRQHHHNEITFGLMYAFTENFVLPLSHDEVVHGKGSLLNKMAGDDWQKFATLRAYFAFMWGYPGKKLLFMGQEFAQRDEWSEKRSLDWHLLEYGPHQGVQSLVRDLNNIYKSEPALHARDCEGEGFDWVLVDAAADSVFAWQRKAPDAPTILIISHFTPIVRNSYKIKLPHAGIWKEILNTDAHTYGGSGVGNLGKIQTDQNGIADLNIPPLGTLILKLES